MIPRVSMRRALSDSKLLGGTLVGDSWRAWRIILTAAAGERLTNSERRIFKQLTGRDHEPGQRVEELVAVVGRRGGKSTGMATLAAYIAGLCKHPLARGEKGVLLCVAPDQRQAGIVLDFATAAFASSPLLKQLIVNRTADTLELANNTAVQRDPATNEIIATADVGGPWVKIERPARVDWSLRDEFGNKITPEEASLIHHGLHPRQLARTAASNKRRR